MKPEAEIKAKLLEVAGMLYATGNYGMDQEAAVIDAIGLWQYVERLWREEKREAEQ